MSDFKEKLSKVKNYLGLFVALAMVGVSLIKVLITETDQILSGKNTLVISHWQMEDGYREGLQEVIDNYISLKEKQGIKVDIRQSVVPYRGYSQWAITQLVGGKPADIMEMMFNENYVSKYFYTLDRFVGLNNPYNEGSPVAGLAWKETFIDGMESVWNRNLLGYYEIGRAHV